MKWAPSKVSVGVRRASVSDYNAIRKRVAQVLAATLSEESASDVAKLVGSWWGTRTISRPLSISTVPSESRAKTKVVCHYGPLSAGSRNPEPDAPSPSWFLIRSYASRKQCLSSICNNWLLFWMKIRCSSGRLICIICITEQSIWLF